MTTKNEGAIAPGSTIGIVGGGQLGRMLAIAATQLGYRCHIFAPEEHPPAAEVAAYFTRGQYDDEAALAEFGKSVDVATYEFENIAAEPLAALAAHAPLRPGPRALEISQDRLVEKTFVSQLGVRTAPFEQVDSLADLDAAIGRIGGPGILKTRRFGYDGKGQVRIADGSDAGEAWRAVNGAPCILEGMIDFDGEFSILLCRTATGEAITWEAPRNEHEDGILRRSTVPAPEFMAEQAAEAARLARTVADSLDYVGVLAIEFFACEGGPLFNEMAPRVHNSGHWTIEGAVTSQFENHIRAICGLPLGDTRLSGAKVVMDNLIGEDVDHWAEILGTPGAHLHLYGKRQARPGRKMGHVTRVER